MPDRDAPSPFPLHCACASLAPPPSRWVTQGESGGVVTVPQFPCAAPGPEALRFGGREGGPCTALSATLGLARPGPAQASASGCRAPLGPWFAPLRPAGPLARAAPGGGGGRCPGEAASRGISKPHPVSGPRRRGCRSCPPAFSAAARGLVCPLQHHSPPHP